MERVSQLERAAISTLSSDLGSHHTDRAMAQTLPVRVGCSNGSRSLRIEQLQLDSTHSGHERVRGVTSPCGKGQFTLPDLRRWRRLRG